MAASTSSKTIPLSKTTKFIVDNRGKTAPTETTGIPLIATNCISNNHLYPSYDRLRYVSQETYDNWFRSHPEPGDIILTNKGSQNGAICLVPDPVDFVIAQDMVALRADDDVIAPLFLFAALRSPDVQRQIRDLDVNGVIPHLKKTDFDKLHLPYPERHAQEVIGKTYFDFCSKIELNRRMNTTLEAIARAFFRSWFLDFEAVRRNAEGRESKREDALFPDSFDDSEMGEIPNEWKMTELDKIATYLNGQALQKFPPSAGETLPVIKIAQLRKGDSSGADRCNTDVPNDYVVQDGDVLFSWSGSLEVELWCGGRGALNQHLFKVTSAEFPKWFYYLWTLHHLDEFRLIAASKATTMGHIQRKHLTEAKVLVPSRPLLSYMTGIMSPIVDRIIANRIESRNLATLRDTLLPKLLSEELGVTSPRN